MIHDEFLQKVYELRELQKQYFKEKNHGVLIRCKNLEIEIDKQLIQFIHQGIIISRAKRTGDRGKQTTAF
jgi:hypothetical protein